VDELDVRKKMTPEKIQLVFTFTVTAICYISLLVVSSILFNKTNHKGFALTSAAFGCWIVERLVLFFANTDFIVHYGNYVRHIYTLSLVLLAIGFLSLLRRFSLIRSSN
jgi:hypothetical protein